ncbi:23S rRNA (uracil(1939)-C(5))-methyltransferase RlmD [Paenibacillus sp. JMULE4]|uniref:23S rRNA (uracil(1939)-C(5))-methyltransferase RlmD n=1 Tax=Paenibacillus sp. JMULE4 TaxID=2518342 RepID=UPI00157578C5|nr:23S rRNA (uracil(1939)-C(5))-methyltransferase RlmD [Paenibacillus sp. JMULE4]NTZ19130.1 23S rRNA (uracil(1939)-C(5))-methyltransferase RlmD [Paenibacillus sp. JMULE4]
MMQDVNKPQQRKRKPNSAPDKRYTTAIPTVETKPAQRSKPQAAHRPGNKGQKPSGSFGGPSSAEDVRVGDRIIVTIKRIGINGEGVGYYRRKAVFVKGALPDEVVKAKITKVEPGYLNADIIELEKRSPDRRKPPCPVYETCGGCQLQHMTYEAQLRAKEELVRESFQRYAGLHELPMRPILGMSDPWGYRNKAQLQTGREGEKMITGLYAAGSHRLVDISGCAVHHPLVNQVIDQVKAILSELQIPIYDERTREGAVRTVVARVGQASGNVQLTLITATDRLPDSRRLVQRIRETLPMVTTIAQNIHKGKSPLVFGEKTVVLWGQERLEETLGDVRFSLSPRAFFQLNPEQTVKLYNAVQEAASLSGSELVVDAYCGTGTIGLWLAPYAREVRGIEIIPEAVQDARDNARASGIENARFFEGRAEQLLPEWVKRGIRPDVVVVDPPRTGCERPLLQALLQARPARLVYVSCNPATLAKDCQVLLSGGYRLEWVQPVDMFPHTAHVECVIGIQRIDT